MEKKKKVTFQDIADYTGFSKTTISRYFNAPDTLTIENQDRISEALKALNYQENKVGRILASGKTEMVGLLIPNLYLHYFSEMLNCLLDTYEQYGYKFLLFAGQGNAQAERRYIRELMAYNIEGMIVMSHCLPSAELASLPVPVVTIEREDKYVSSVNTDNYMGGVQATGLLYKNNCDILIHINSLERPEIPAHGRLSGFLDTCREHALRHEVYARDFGNSYAAMSGEIQLVAAEILEKYAGLRKGIFLSNDTYANIFLNYVLRRFGALPEDIRIVGFDGSPISEQAVIPISTVAQQIDKIAVTAMGMLVERMNERKKRRPVLSEEPEHRVIPPILIPRETSLPVYERRQS